MTTSMIAQPPAWVNPDAAADILVRALVAQNRGLSGWRARLADADAKREILNSLPLDLNLQRRLARACRTYAAGVRR